MERIPLLIKQKHEIYGLWMKYHKEHVYHRKRFLIEFCKENSLAAYGLTYSPITGATGNIEFLIYLKNNKDIFINEENIKSVIEKAHKNLI